MTTDPACKINVKPDKAAAKENSAGQEYYIYSDTCQMAFVAEPEKYVNGAVLADHSCCGGHK